MEMAVGILRNFTRTESLRRSPFYEVCWSGTSERIRPGFTGSETSEPIRTAGLLGVSGESHQGALERTLNGFPNR